MDDHMCRQATCRSCQKTTWAGCGAHVQQVMGPVPEDQRCRCAPADRGAARGESLLARLFRR
jgi:hypothetical protein